MTWVDDVRQAVRKLAGEPGFTATVTLVLALGIGANTAVFSLLNAVVLAPLPFPEPDRLVRLLRYHDSAPEQLGEFMPGPDFVDIRNEARSFASVAATYLYDETGEDLTSAGEPERVRALSVSADYFDLIGTRPAIGRAFRRDEEREDAGVVVVSDALWRRRLGADPRAVGSELVLSGVRHTVVGVMPRGFQDLLGSEVDVWKPEHLRSGKFFERGNNYLSLVGRLRPGVSLEQAEAEVEVVSARLARAYRENQGQHVRLVPLHEDLAGDASRRLGLLLAAVGFVLLIACANVANLVLARGLARQRELAVRAALGASAARLARQLLTEALALAALGGVAGLALASLVSSGLAQLAPESLRSLAPVSFDGRVFLFTLVTAVAVGLLFGLVPALRFARVDPDRSLREGARGEAAGGHGGLRGPLVAAEVALAVVLVVGAGLLMKSLRRLEAVNLGIRADSVLTFRVNLPDARYGAPEDRIAFHARFAEALARLPGVSAAGSVTRLPVTGRYHQWGFRIPGYQAAPGEFVSADQRVVEGRYFEALGIPLREGRLFRPDDDATAPLRVVVSDALARAYFPGRSPVGAMLRLAGTERTIVGVVADVPIDAQGRTVPMVYHAHRQFGPDRNWALTYAVAAEGARPGLLADARRALAALDPQLVLHQPRALEEVVGRARGRERFAALLMGGFAALALALSAAGIYGVLTYNVGRRRQEIAVRMAIGAGRASVERMVLGQALGLVAAGLAAGLLGAAWLGRFLRALLFEVSPLDPVVLAATVAALLSAALLAAYLPARRAAGVDPAEALRES